MPSSYSVNLLLELMADGENDALWGDITNENLEILGRAISGVTTLSLTGTATTLTTLQGTLSEGHYQVLELGGSPTGTNTITISPNTVARVYFVKNGSGQDAVFTQGSGGNVTVANGDSAIVYCNGGGTGAKVTELTADFLRGANNLSDVADAPTALTNLGITATAAEINVLDGATLDISAVTATAAEVNILDGVTATTAEINILDGVTATTAEVNILDGVTATTAEINYVDGVTSSIQTQLNGKASTATQAEAAWEAGTSTTESLVSPAKVKAAIDTLALGVGQTWQTPSRVTGVSYQNTTGKPIQVTTTLGDTGQFQVSVDNSTWIIVGAASPGFNGGNSSAIVPDQWYYRATGPVSYRAELR